MASRVIATPDDDPYTLTHIPDQDNSRRRSHRTPSSPPPPFVDSPTLIQPQNRRLPRRHQAGDDYKAFNAGVTVDRGRQTINDQRLTTDDQRPTTDDDFSSGSFRTLRDRRVQVGLSLFY